MPEVSSTVPVCSVSGLSEKSIRAVHVMVQAFVFVLFVFVSFFGLNYLKTIMVFLTSSYSRGVA